jgi:transmembrane sensor
MSKKKHYRKLVRRYLQNKASTEELEVFFDLLEKGKLQPFFQKLLQTYAKKETQAPGWNHALLTLSNGRIVDLDSNSASLLQLQQNARLVRNNSGEWSYHSKAGDSASITYNTLSAPGGGQFSFLLEDGTRVWPMPPWPGRTAISVSKKTISGQ